MSHDAVNLLGLTTPELENWAQSQGQPAFRGRQLAQALFVQRSQSFEAMSNLPKAWRAQLAGEAGPARIERPRIDACQVSPDGTRKYRFVADDNTAFEAVYIPEVAKDRKTNTLCVSSQTGCAVGCKFCFTASLRRNRDLSAAEIVGQVLAVQDDVLAAGDPSARVSNIVYMGMGEPLLNYDQVVQSIRVLTDRLGVDLSTRRVTVSTSGIVPRIYDLGRDVNTQLAISLNATTDDVRTRIMPINKKWPLATLIEAMRAYPLRQRRRITVEYVMLKGVNDTIDDAHRLIQLLEGIPVKVNLLPLNPHDRTVFETPDDDVVDRFQQVLRRAGLTPIVRRARGRKIAAACGQLGTTVTPTTPATQVRTALPAVLPATTAASATSPGAQTAVPA